MAHEYLPGREQEIKLRKWAKKLHFFVMFHLFKLRLFWFMQIHSIWNNHVISFYSNKLPLHLSFSFSKSSQFLRRCHAPYYYFSQIQFDLARVHCAPDLGRSHTGSRPSPPQETSGSLMSLCPQIWRCSSQLLYLLTNCSGRINTALKIFFLNK